MLHTETSQALIQLLLEEKSITFHRSELKGHLKSSRPILYQMLEFPHQIHFLALTKLLTLTVFR